MKNTNGGFTYNDIMKLSISELIVYNNEVAKMIKRENKSVKNQIGSR